MSTEMIFTNARVVTRDADFMGTVAVSGGAISAVDTGRAGTNGTPVVDCEGDLLIPGLIEPHTDNLEKQLMPRPGVLWPSALAALTAHDTQVAGAGITTVLDSICCGELNEGKMRRRIFELSVEAVHHGRDTDVLRADHLLHLRCEICDPVMQEHFEPMADDPLLRLVSLMDHTPGQRQFTSHAKYREYYGHMNWSDEQFERMVRDLREVQERVAPVQRARVIEMCRERAVPLASHDDTTVEHVDRAGEEGIGISEFPTTEAAARRCRDLGLSIVLGAPNVVRGGSHSGNVSARDMASGGLLDILSSDYVPSSLLHAALLLHAEMGLALSEAVALVTDNPARALGLADRGRIEAGLRADLVRVRLVEGYPVVREVYKRGRKIL